MHFLTVVSRHRKLRFLCACSYEPAKTKTAKKTAAKDKTEKTTAKKTKAKKSETKTVTES